jgi:hypothetical protein
MTPLGRVMNEVDPPARATLAVHDQFPGHYRLLSSTRRHRSGEEVDLQGAEPSGQTYYDTTGRMWVLLAPPGRSAVDPETATAVDYRRLLHGVVAYYGTYDVDPAQHIVVHRVLAALRPDWVGQRLVRHYEFRGPRLTLIMQAAEYSVHTVYERLDEAAAPHHEGTAS